MTDEDNLMACLGVPTAVHNLWSLLTKLPEKNEEDFMHIH